ncbi:MAG TPA: hypothetical protein VHY20_13590, partial [Pirellulales bacterium]|nr:hypothetical protein [Pirellulales bacterium]
MLDLAGLAAWLEPGSSLAGDAPPRADLFQQGDLLTAVFAAEGVAPRQAAEYTARLDAWAGELGALPSAPAERAAAALAWLHERALKEYDPRASSLAGVFAEGRYNCLGSTLAFVALARRLDLACWTVERPGHVLARLELEECVIDVETTCAQGVGQQASGASGERRLSPPALLGLVYFNRGCDLLERR